MSDPTADLRDLLGADCSPTAHLPHGSGVVAYAVFRGIALAALGIDAAAATAALRDKVTRQRQALAAAEELPGAVDVNLVLEQQGRPPVRQFVRAMTPERALLELEAGIAGAVVFHDARTRTFCVLWRCADGTPQQLRIGEPVRGDDAAARPLPVPGRAIGTAEVARLRAQKALRVRALLRCPGCRGALQEGRDALRCGACARDYPVVEGRPVFARDPAYDASPRGKLESQNPYGMQVLELIERHRDGWVLDMGSGSPSQGFHNVVHLDLSAYPQVDVVTDGSWLPFGDAVFDAVLSEAVLEHVRDPGVYMAELARVLQPGGRVRLDVAFLQPFHAYPDHYFNMTASGLRQVVETAGLRVLSLDVGEHQMPWVALGLMLSGFVRGTADEGLRQQILGTTIGDALGQMEQGSAPAFQGLGAGAIQELAAGFWCLAEKPR